MHYPYKSSLPESLRRPLEDIGAAIIAGNVEQSELDAVIGQIAALPLEKIASADGEIGHLARLYNTPRFERPRPRLILFGRNEDSGSPRLMPGIQYLFIFHRNGFEREAALNGLHDGLPSAFFFTAVAYRLNDWAPQVRQAALACAERVFPKTRPEIVAEAALFLLNRKLFWQRGVVEFAVLDRAFAHPDVACRLAAAFETAHSGPVATVLKCALRGPGVDGYLLRLAGQAFLPSVRKVALQCLLERRAVWQVGVEKQWIDKSLGDYRLVPTLATREIEIMHPLEDLIRLGVSDRSAMVRRAALDALIKHRATLSIVGDIVRLLHGDKSRPIQERLDFILRVQPELREA